ncbi:vacuolar H+ ATPase subunit AC39-1 [Sarcoptes scabiei]|nr:vacuolar H+ ATPase subunit AC39-1 [Sarcoptes scabiei]
MEAIEIKPTEIICLQANDSLFDLDFIRKCLIGLLEYKNLLQKIYNEPNSLNDEKHRFEYERIDQRFQEVIRGNEQVLQRYIQDDWTTTDEFSTTLQSFCDPSMGNSEVSQAYITTAVPTTTTTVGADNLNSSYNCLGEKKDVMAIAAAEVVMHSYENGLYICGWPSCEYQTSSRRHINNHKLVHTGDGEFNCGFPECGRRFKSREELNEHAAIHNSDHPYPCVWPGCVFRSKTPASLKAHMRVHMERKYKCEWPDCNEEFGKTTDLIRHRSTVHDQNNSATQQQSQSNQSGSVASAAGSTVGTTTVVAPTVVAAGTGQSNQTVQIVQQSPQQQPQQVTVVAQQPPQQLAQIINVQGQTGASLQPTQITGQLPSGQQVTLIQLQQTPSSNIGTAIAHKTIVAQQPASNAQVIPSTQPQPITTAIAVAGTNAMINTQLFRCNNPTCNSLFSTLYDLKQHMMQHTKVKQMFLIIFPLIFALTLTLTTQTQANENKNANSAERNYVCGVENCGRRYKTRKGLWDHSHTHRSDKPYACNFPNCNYRAVSSSYLRSHMRAHKGHNATVNNTNVINTAPQNVVATNSQQFLAPGTMIQHSNGTQEFICGLPNCNKSFDSQFGYLNHVKSHAATAPPTQIAQVVQAPAPAPPPPPKNRCRNPELARFKCEFVGCNAAYKLKRNLKDHMIRHTILEKPYRCDWPGCDYGSYKSTNVAKHKSVHSDERKYACDFFNCDKKFKTREGLRKHMLSHHKPPVVTNNINSTTNANTTTNSIQIKIDPAVTQNNQ